MPNKTEHLYMTLVETGEAVVLSDELAEKVGVNIGTLRKLLSALVSAGVAEKRRLTGTGAGQNGHGPRAEYLLTGKPYEAPPRKKSVMIHDDHIGEPIIERFPYTPRWRSIGAWIMGDPPVGRSALDIGAGRVPPTHRVRGLRV